MAKAHSQASPARPSLEELAREIDQLGSEQLVLRRLLNELREVVYRLLDGEFDDWDEEEQSSPHEVRQQPQRSVSTVFEEEAARRNQARDMQQAAFSAVQDKATSAASVPTKTIQKQPTLFS